MQKTKMLWASVRIVGMLANFSNETFLNINQRHKGPAFNKQFPLDRLRRFCFLRNPFSDLSTQIAKPINIESRQIYDFCLTAKQKFFFFS